MSAIDPKELRKAFSTFMTGVTVVTTIDSDGAPVGFTANSYTSVSLEPPLLLVCPAKSMSQLPVFQQCQHFVINILSEGQQKISNTFATAKGDRFAGLNWEADEAGCPILEGTAASFSCSTHERVDAGDHIILIGHINNFQVSGALGLGYSRDGYFSLGLERKVQEMRSTEEAITVGAIIEYEGQVLMEETPQGLCLPEVTVKGRHGALLAMHRFLKESGLQVELGPVYSLFEARSNDAVYTYYRAHAKSAQAHKNGRYIPIEQLPYQTFSSKVHDAMIKRYVLEWKNRIFGLYLGDELEGDVHIFPEEPKP